MSTERFGFAWIFAAILALGAGCGDSDEGSRFGDAGPTLFPDDGGTSGVPVAVTISAADGGEITNGSTTLAIPADALADDTEITITPVAKAGLPDEDTIASDVFDFGPDGTMFETPVTLTFEFDAAAAPDGMVGTIAYLDGDAWVPLDDSRVSGDTVTATTDHFTYFAVVWTVDQSAGACEDFAPCGTASDLVGTWNVSLGCITLPPNLLGDPNDPQNPFAGCDGITSEGDIEITGTITFNDDDTFETDLTFAVDIQSRIPSSCVPMGGTCMDLGGTEDGDACVVGMPSTNTEMATGTYEVSGTSLTTTNEGKEPGMPVDFCVEGNTLTVRSPGTDSSPEIGYVAEKQ